MITNDHQNGKECSNSISAGPNHYSSKSQGEGRLIRNIRNPGLGELPENG